MTTVYSAFSVLLCAAALLSPTAYAGSLTGEVDISELYPEQSTVFDGGTAMVPVGGSVTCPGLSNLCESGYLGAVSTTLSVGADTLEFSQTPTYFSGADFNGFSFTGLVFSDGGSLSNVTLASSLLANLSAADVTFTGSSIFINLANVVVSSSGSQNPGTFTLTLTDSTSAAPEPGTLLLLGMALAGVSALTRTRS